jgi:predicted nucleic acid-binding protein
LSDSGCRYVLHWGILLEIGDGFARFDRRQRGIDLLDRFLHDRGYSVLALSDALLTGAVELYQSRKDKSWGLTDCISFTIMNEAGITDALTADIHFQQAGFRALLLEP